MKATPRRARRRTYSGILETSRYGDFETRGRADHAAVNYVCGSSPKGERKATSPLAAPWASPGRVPEFGQRQTRCVVAHTSGSPVVVPDTVQMHARDSRSYATPLELQQVRSRARARAHTLLLAHMHTRGRHAHQQG